VFRPIALFALAFAMLASACTATVSGSRTRIYHSIAQLDADSVGVALVRATGTQTVERVAGIPFTVTTVSVVNVLRGSLSGPSVKVRQLGGPGVAVDEGAPLLQAGRDYVLFLQPFSFGPGQSTDQYTVTGAGAGLFAASGGIAQALDPVSTDLPRAIAITDLRAQVQH
jgi:hypothetical protein